MYTGDLSYRESCQSAVSLPLHTLCLFPQVDNGKILASSHPALSFIVVCDVIARSEVIENVDGVKEWRCREEHVE